MLFFKCLIGAWFCLFLSLPALASDVIFPVGGAVGLSPPGAMTAHIGLTMFEDKDEDAVISIFEEARAEAPERPFADFGNFDEMLSGMRGEEAVQYLQLAGGIEAYLSVYSDVKDGVARRHWTMVAGNADLFVVIIARAPADSILYSDAEMQAALQSTEFRPRGSLAGEIAGLPFTISDHAEFQTVQTIGGNTLLLMDLPKTGLYFEPQPMAIIGFTRYENALDVTKNEDARRQRALAAILSLHFTNIEITHMQVKANGEVLIMATGIEPEGEKKTLQQIMRFDLHGIIRTVCVSRPQHDITTRCDQIGRSVMIKNDDELSD